MRRLGFGVGVVLVLCGWAGAAGEAVRVLPDSSALNRWHFSNGAEFPGAKGRLAARADGGLALEYDFRGGGQYVAAYHEMREPAAIREMAFVLRKDAAATITVRVTDSKGQTFQKSVVDEHSGRRRYVCRMHGWTGHWGGPDDGIVRPPFVRMGILLEKSGIAPTGTMEIFELEYETGAVREGAGAVTSTYRVTDFGAGSGFGAGGGTLEGGVWEVDFERNRQAWLGNSISLAGSPKSLTLRLSSDAEGSVLKMRLGSHFQTFEREIGTLSGGSQRIEVGVPPEGWRYFGGENDGRIHPPLRLTGLILERGSCRSKRVRIELEGLDCTVETGPAESVVMEADLTPADASAGRLGLELSCVGRNLRSEAAEGKLDIRLLSWDGQVLSRGSRRWVIPGGGLRADLTERVSIPDSVNFAEAEFSYEVSGLGRFTAAAYYTKPLADAGDAELKPDSPWGMGVYLYRYGDNAAGHAAMERAAAMAQAAGVKWSREEFSWARTEPRQGQFDFQFYDRVVDTAQRHGISVYGLLSYWSSWTDAYTEKGIDDFCVWARAVVRRYKGRVRHWEVYNEPNIFFWSGPKELCPLLLKRCYKAIKEEDPEAVVLGVSTAGIDRGFIRSCLDAGAPFDILTIHPYRRLLSERSFMAELRETAELVGSRPVWITEMGWSTQVGAASERTQAQMLARCYLSAAASGACQNVSWYNFRCDGSDGFYNEHNFGVLRNDLSEKPAYRALATLCRTMDDGAPKARSDFGPDVYALEMGKALALWTGRQAVDVTISSRAAVTVSNLMGEVITPERQAGNSRIRLSAGSPVFLTGEDIRALGVRSADEASEESGEVVF